MKPVISLNIVDGDARYRYGTSHSQQKLLMVIPGIDMEPVIPNKYW